VEGNKEYGGGVEGGGAERCNEQLVRKQRIREKWGGG